MARVVQRNFSAHELRALLRDLKLSDIELARRSGVSTSAIGKWQREGSKSQTTPQVDVLWKAVEAIAAVAHTSGREEFSGRSPAELTDAFMERLIQVPPAERELADWRALRGFTQPDLAPRVGVSITTLSTLERGASQLTEEVEQRLAAVLRITSAEVRAAWLRTKNRP